MAFPYNDRLHRGDDGELTLYLPGTEVPKATKVIAVTVSYLAIITELGNRGSFV